MTPGGLAAWIELVQSLGLGLTVAVLVFIWALYRGKIMFGWHCRALERERDAWRETALAGKDVLFKLVEREERRL